MRRNLRSALLALLLAGTGSAFLYAANDTTVADIIAMSQAHVSDATILLFVEKNQICLPLSADDLAAMREAGLSRLLIDNLVDRMADCQADGLVAYDAPPVDGYGYPPGFYSSYCYPGYYAFSGFPGYFFFDHRRFSGRRGPVRHPVHRGGVVRVPPRGGVAGVGAITRPGRASGPTSSGGHGAGRGSAGSGRGGSHGGRGGSHGGHAGGHR